MFVTAWLGIMDMRSGVLSYANAGHNPPLLRRRNGNFEYVKTRPNFILAGMEGTVYRKNEIRLVPGDELFLYTDGVTEATNEERELLGEDRLLKVLNGASEESVEARCKTVKKAINEFVGNAEQFDDITMLALRFNFFRNDESILTPADSASTEGVWNFINRRMKYAELSSKITNKAQIIVDEIYSNIHQYSGASKSQVFCRIESDKMILTFKDDGIPYDPLMGSDPDTSLSAEDREFGGLGIFMVKKLASDITYAYEDGYNVLTVTINIDTQK
jgi:sigma-B regulation protein RsbU (phosphoserine phosphatase)